MEKYALNIKFSDVVCYEIVKRISYKCFEVRLMKQEMVNKKEINSTAIVAGFSSVVDTSIPQEWSFETDMSNPIERIRLGKKGWKGKAGRFTLSEKPYAYYDINF